MDMELDIKTKKIGAQLCPASYHAARVEIQLIMIIIIIIIVVVFYYFFVELVVSLRCAFVCMHVLQLSRLDVHTTTDPTTVIARDRR